MTNAAASSQSFDGSKPQRRRKKQTDEVQPDLGALIAQGESETVEFKASARWDLRANAPNKALEAVIVKTVAGLLNARGGILLIGVDDKGTAVGLEQDFKTLSKRPDQDGYQQFLVNLFSSSLGKDVCAYISISFQSIDEQDICVLRIQKSLKPIYVGEGQQTRFSSEPAIRPRN